jgi:hypothetical protein
MSYFQKWSFEGAQQRIGNGPQERALICSVAKDKIKGLYSLVLVYVTSELSELPFAPLGLERLTEREGNPTAFCPDCCI